MKNIKLSNSEFQNAHEGTRVYTEPGDRYVANYGSTVFACRDSEVIANNYSCVIAEKGSKVIALDDSLVFAEKGCSLFRRRRSVICFRSIDKINPPIRWARKENETFGDNQIIIAFPGAKFDAGASCIVVAPSSVKCRVGDFSKIYAGEKTFILVGHDCDVTALSKTCIVERDPIIKPLPKYQVIEE